MASNLWRRQRGRRLGGTAVCRRQQDGPAISAASNAMSLGPKIMIGISRLGNRIVLLTQIAIGIGENNVTHRLVVFDVAGATAEVAVESLSDRGVECGALDRCFRQPFQQHLAFVQKARVQ